MLRAVAKSILPKRTRAQLIARHREFVLRRALERLRRRPDDALDVDSNIVVDLIYGWGNEGWSASRDYLTACIRESLACRGNILECGSGITTLAVGVILEQTGGSLHALEHDATWARRVRLAARGLGIRSATVHCTPLENYGDYSWYQLNDSVSSTTFSLVLCDGPPSQTFGGRYGLLPRARGLLEPDSVILLDDASRTDEQAVAMLWRAEGPMSCTTLGTTSPYFRLTT